MKITVDKEGPGRVVVELTSWQAGLLLNVLAAAAAVEDPDGAWASERYFAHDFGGILRAAMNRPS